MGKIVGLISSGIGLAMEAKTSYGSGSNKTYVKDGSHMQKDESYRRYLMESPRAQSKGSTYERDISFYAHELPDQRIPPARGLSCPVILPQRRPEDQSRGIIRAYSPELACCGIDQMTFLEFIDDFNEAHKSSPYLDAVNVAAQGVGFAPGISPMVVSMVVPIAVRAAKGYQTQRQSTSFLDRANTDLFIPHGLFAMVLTFKPNQTQSPYGAPKQIQLPPSAPLIYPEDERRAQQTGLKKMGHFISDYGDRRAQARYASNNPDSSLASPLPKFGNRWADPNHPANGGGLKSLLTGVPDDGKSRKQERKDRKQDRKDRHRRRSSSSDSSKRSGLLSTALSAAGEASGRNGLSRNERPSLVGTAREMINGPEKQNQSLIKGVKSLGMNTNILYLMITNNCNTNDENPSIPSTRSQIPFTYTSTIPPHHTQPTHSTTLLNSSEPSQKPIYPTAHQNRTFTYTAAQQQNNNPYINKQTQIQTQTQVASIASSNYTTRAFEAHDVPPPPAYREVMPMRYYERMRGDDEEFCVPTL